MDKDRQILLHCLKWSDCQLCQYGQGAFIDKEPFRVFYKGNPNGRVVIIGEGPGADEIKSGRPFIGRAGKLLNSILKFANIPTWDCIITNTIICSDDGKKKPTPDVMDACRPRVLEIIDLVKPKLIITLGLYAANCLIQKPCIAMRDLLGKEDIDFDGIPMRCAYHPAYLLRNPSAKKQAAVRWKAIGKFYERINTGPV